MVSIADGLQIVTKLMEAKENRRFAEELRAVHSMIREISKENGNLHDKNRKLNQENEELQQSVGSLERKVATLQQNLDSTRTVPTAPTEKLSDEQKCILRYLAQISYAATLTEVPHKCEIAEIKAKYWLNELSARQLVDIVITMGGPGRYYLTDSDTKFLVENGLV